MPSVLHPASLALNYNAQDALDPWATGCMALGSLLAVTARPRAAKPSGRGDPQPYFQAGRTPPPPRPQSAIVEGILLRTTVTTSSYTSVEIVRKTLRRLLTRTIGVLRGSCEIDAPEIGGHQTLVNVQIASFRKMQRRTDGF